VFDQVTEAMLDVSEDKKAARQNAKILWSILHGICLLRSSGKLNITESDPAEELVKRFMDQYFNLKK